MDQREFFLATMKAQQEALSDLAVYFKRWEQTQDMPLRQEWMIAQAGSSQPIRIPGVKSMYVDNSGNDNTFKIRMDGELGVYIVPAGCGAHLPCFGVKTLEFEGSGQAYIRLSNVAVPPTAVNSAQQVTFPAPQPVTFPTPQEVTVGGSLPNLTVGPLTLIATFSYSLFPANTTVVLFQKGVLTPEARKRSYILTNNLGQTVTNVQLLPALLGNGPAIGYNRMNTNDVMNTVTSMAVGTANGNDTGVVADSIELVVTVGTTAPTAGNFTVQVLEVF